MPGRLPIMETENIVRLLTIGSLAGLLAAVGMRLTVTQVVNRAPQGRVGAGCDGQFCGRADPCPGSDKALRFRIRDHHRNDLVGGGALRSGGPGLCSHGAGRSGPGRRVDSSVSAPFSILTPFVCELTLTQVAHAASVRFNVSEALLILLATIVLPLCLGLLVKHVSPPFARRILRPVEIFSEATGAASLAFVTATEWQTILTVGWRPLLAMAIVSEICLLLGYSLGGPDLGARRVIGLGTSNRNIALALLMALQAFGGTPVVSAVVANGLLLILLGLVHVAFWRFRGQRASE